MKFTIYLVFAALLVTFTSCNEKTEENLEEVDTHWNVDIPITSVISEGGHKFVGFTEYDISNIVYSSESINSIYRIKPRSGSYIMLSGVNENYSIKSLSLMWNYQSTLKTNVIVQESIDLLALHNKSKSDGLHVNLDAAIGDLINKIDDPNGIVSIEISGICDYDLNAKASLSIPITVESKNYNPRFELF